MDNENKLPEETINTPEENLQDNEEKWIYHRKAGIIYRRIRMFQ